MEPNEALAELLDLSSQVDEVAILGESGFVLACTGTPERGERLAEIASELMEAAGHIDASGTTVSRLEVSLAATSVFVVREGGRTVVATTVPEPTAGLVVYDLRTALRRLEDEPVNPPKARRPKGKSGA